MKQLLLIFLLIFIPLIAFTQRSLSYLRNDTKVKKLVVLPPLTIIHVISEKSDESFDSTLTQYTDSIIVDILKSSFSDSIQKIFFDGDAISKRNISSFSDELNREIFYERQLKKYKVPDAIVHLFDTANTCYILGTCYVGIKSVSMNLISSSATSHPIDYLFNNKRQLNQSAILSTCFVINLKEKNILYFEKTIWYDRNPTDIKAINLAVTNTIKHYFIQ